MFKLQVFEKYILWINILCLFLLPNSVREVECDCSGIDEPNSTRDPSKTSFLTDESVTYTCTTGYEHTSGSLLRTCQADTFWNGSSPGCTIKTCSQPASVSNSLVSPNQVSYDYGTSITYSCDTGYSHTSGNLTRTCQADTTWSGTQPVCTIKTCSQPASVSNSLISPNQVSYDYGTSITYSCDTGYSHTSGNLTRTCQADTTWSGTQPVCTIITCPSPTSVSYSSRTPDQVTYDYGASITYSCDTGYSHASGNLTRICQNDTTWSGIQPECTVKTCPSPIAVPNASVIPVQVTYNYSASITYSCDIGYSHTSGNLTRTCQTDTTWSESEPVCTVKTCPSPAAVSNASVIPVQVTYNYSTSITYSCDIGFSHTNGNLTRTCQADTAWSGSEPVCTLKTCPSPAAVSNASVIPIQVTYNYSTSITYSCDIGYSHTSGNLTRTCQFDTSWSGGEPECTLKTCPSPVAVPNASVLPVQITYNYSTSITYSCDIGFSHTSGNITRTCQSDTTWSGSEPVCTLKTCPSPSAVPNASVIPVQVTYNYSTSITYSCDIGYSHTSGNLTRICQSDTMWSGIEPVCTIKTCPSPASVSNASVTPVQVTYNYSTSLTYSCDIGYSHTSGNLTRICQSDTTWSGNEPVCTIKTCPSPAAVSNASVTPVQVTYNYSTSITYSCDIGYSHTSGNLTRICQSDTTWYGSEPVCTIKTCPSPAAVSNASVTPVQVAYNFSSSLTYSCDIGYSHTSGNLTRICQSDTTWSGSEPVCTIKTCPSPAAVSNASVTPVQITYNYSSSITYSCDIGYSHTSGNLTRICQSDTTWSGSEPVCTIKTCPSPAAVSNASVTPVKVTYDYSTFLTYSCDIGYSHTSGNLTRICQSDTTWSGNEPVCTIKTCPSPSAVSNASVTPVQVTYNYSTSITYSCDIGYSHTSGNLTRICQSDTTWSGNEPVCTIKWCYPPHVPGTSSSPDQLTYNYSSIITYSCITSYLHTSGNLTRTCQADTTWSGIQPVCTIKTCPSPAAVSNASVIPVQVTYNYSTSITYSCDIGFSHTNGNLTRTCQADTTWSGSEPVCTINTCISPAPVPNSSRSPDQISYNYTTTLTYICDVGYTFTNGNLTRTCQSDSTWSGSSPVCTINTCTPDVVPNSSRSPTLSTIDYGSNITYTCDAFYNHTGGDLTRLCEADSSWSGSKPICTIAACLPHPSISLGTVTPIKSRYEFTETVTITCDTGYYISTGNNERTCQTSGTWNGTEPTCSLVVCSVPSSVSHATVTSTGPYNYNTNITYTCDLSFVLTSGDLTRTCQDDFTWSGSAPVCTVDSCIKEDSTYMTASPNTILHDFGDLVTYSCILGYNHSSGHLKRLCLPDGSWNGTLPACEIVTCPLPAVPEYSSITPNDALIEFNNTITYSCNLGYNRTAGDETRTCAETGKWTGTEATCTLVTCSPPVNISNGSYQPEQTIYNYSTVVTYTCEYGYYLSSGTPTTQCDETASWTGTTQICSIVQCTVIDEPNSSYSPPQMIFDFNTTVTYICDTGHNRTAGNDVRRCQNDTTWDGVNPVCDPVVCSFPESVEFATLSPTQLTYVYQDWINYTCNLGYNMTSGNASRQCDEHAEWTGQLPICTLVTCTPPVVIPSASYQPLQSIYNYSTTVTYTCDYGYYLSSGSLTVQCDETASWSGLSPVCSIVQCTVIDEPNSSYSPTQAIFDFNTTVTYTCDTGHNRTSGNDVRICQNDTTWDGINPVCDPVICSFPESVEFATSSPSQLTYVYQDWINYTCILGYNMTSGNASRQCDEHAEWTGQLPICTLVTCTPPAVIPSASYQPLQSIYNYSTIVTYTCDYGYYLSSGSLTVQCDETASWSGLSPVCSIVQCTVIDEPNSSYSPSKTIFDFNTTVTYTCDTGHNRTSGNDVRICQNDTTWDGLNPVCEPVICSFPESVEFATSSPTQLTYVYQDWINYTCILGYNMTSGNASRQCDEHAEWTGQLPICTLITCNTPLDIPNASYRPVQGIYNYSTVVTYECNYGYYLSSGSLSIQCDETASWTGSTPVCTIVQCTAIDEPNSSYFPTKSIFDFNTTITYTCDIGHNRTGGNDVRVCQNDTTWDGGNPVCDPVICSYPESVDFSTTTPTQVTYIYLDWIHYTCVFGYEMTSGNASRQCDEHAEWTGQLPNCTIKKCVPPPIVQNASYTPVQVEHNWNTSVVYSCDTGYEYNGGDITRTCQDNKTWSGELFSCKIKKCPRIDVQHMTLTPADSGGEYVYLTQITYACVLGYNHSYGDLQRTCLDTKAWSGNLPNCTIVTCDPPVNIAHTNYDPVQVEYVWQDDIHYSCDPLYHYVSGINMTTCNESGSFPQVDFNCSVMHTLVKNAAEPQYTWINETTTSANILFDFDGMCDVTLIATPSSLSVSHSLSGTSLTVNVSEQISSVYGIYVVTLSPFRLWRNFENVTASVFYGRAIEGLQGWVDNPISTLMVDGEYTFEVNTTDGTTVQLDWNFEGTGNVTHNYNGIFKYANQSHIFNSPGDYNVTVTATNAISSQTTIIPVKAVYGINKIILNASTNTPNTTQTIDLHLKVKASADLPMYEVNITVSFGDDTLNVTESDDISADLSLPHFYSYSHLYPVQGDYIVRAKIQNWIDYKEYSQTIRVWDPLQNLDLDYITGNGHYITNSSVELEFIYPPESGFLYTVDYDDGSPVESMLNTEIYKFSYNFTNFTHIYTSPGVYNLRWTAQNGLYSRDEKKIIIVQNPVPSHSYTLMPIGKKYPWSNLQVMDVSVNITLNNTVALPTNATCDYDATDGSGIVYGLKYEGPFFQHLHRFLAEGEFQPKLNCSNLVSNYSYVYNLTVLKYHANFTTVIYESPVPLNISDSVTVYFHIDNSGFALIPYSVTLTFDFGNGIDNFQYDRTTFSRAYSARGNYNITVTVASSVTSTIYIRTYPLRLGIMYFNYNGSIQFINSTVVTYSMYGVLGNTDYTVDYTDGSMQKKCLSTDISGCDIHHLCPTYSNNTNVITASNGTFVEIDEAYVICDNPITVTIDIPEFKSIPDGTIDLKLRITEDDLYIPNLFCNISMGDPIQQETYLFNQTVTFDDPFNFTYQYIALGRHSIALYCWNLINETRINDMITLTNKDFLFFGSFDRQYSQIENPLPLTSMRDTELFSRLVILANSSEKHAVNEWNMPVSIGDGINRHSLLFPVGQVRKGLYRVVLRTYFKEEVNNVIFEPTYVEFIAPSPQVHLVGGRIRKSERGLVILDAQTLSYDPVDASSPLTFGTWRCFGYEAVSFADAEVQFIGSIGGTSCTLTSVNGTSTMSIDTVVSPQKPYYVVEVTASTIDNINETNYQIINILDNSFNPLNIRCLINCLSKVAVSAYLQVIVDTNHNCQASYSWTIQEKGGSSLSLIDKTDTGTSNRSLSIKPNVLSPGTWYIITVLMLYEGVYYGPAYHEFVTNMPPQGGTCEVYQFNYGAVTHSSIFSTSGLYETMVGKDEFNISCSGWRDEGFTENTLMDQQPLFYYFYYQYGPEVKDRQILYFDPGSTSNLVTLRTGNPDTDYSGKLVLRISDVIGDYTEITYNVNVRPPENITTDYFLPLVDSTQLIVIEGFTDLYEEEMIKANRTWDYRTLSRKIQDVTSVYNQLVLNSTVTIVLSPEDLLTLGNQRNEQGEILSWNEYWNLIVDVQESQATNHLVQFGERLTAALHYTVNTWPTNKRIPLVSIETISNGLSATLERTEYANNTAAIFAAYSSEKLSEDLVIHTQDREFPPTEQLECAISAIFELNMYILNLLQTVLTPNLPEDPTVDEMRSYLEYIQLFEETGGTANQSQLSLQEQTFLAQKQLQKYHLQKHLKSEASKTALPSVTSSFNNLAKVLKSMSTLGRREIVLQNDFTYLSVEKTRAFALRNTDLVRPRTVLQIGSLAEVNPAQCNASEVSITTTIFKKNPYFWGTFADRITSYVSTFLLEGATLLDPTLTFRLQNHITPSCTDATPTYDENDENKMIYILLNRRYQDDDILLFIRPEASELTYEVYFNQNEKPDLLENKYIFTTQIHTNMWTQEDGYKLLVTSQEFSATGQIWIALRPLLGDSQDESLLQRKFCARVTSVNCVVWKPTGDGEYNWDRYMCAVSELSSRSETVCVCENPSDLASITIGTTFYVPKSKVDFQDLEDTTLAYSMQTVYGLIYATLGAYFILAIWLWREDIKDPYKWAHSLLIDNDIADQHFYMLRVFTGMRSRSGTKSKIAFVLAGENSDTGIRILDDRLHLGFETGSVRTFVMGTRRNLGELMSLRIWHDDTGLSNAAWFLNQITVTDLHNFQTYGFYCDNWLDYDRGDQLVDRVLPATPIQEAWSFKEMSSYTMAEHHTWISTFLRPFRSSFTRIQRLSCLIGMVYLNMFLCTLFLKTKTEEEITKEFSIGPFRFSSENFNVAVTTVCISTLIISMVSFLFRFSRSRNHLVFKDSFLVRHYKRFNARFMLDKTVLNMRFPPAENAIVYDYNFLPHFVVYVAWTLLFIFVALGAYFMISTAKSWPKIKSEEWMTTVIVSGFVSFLMIEIVKVILIIIPYLLLCKRAYEPPQPYIDVETLKEIAKYNSASLTVQPDFKNDLRAAVSPDEDTLLEHKKERMNNHQLLKMFTQLAFYSGILFIVYTISYAKRDIMSYNLKKSIEDSFSFGEVNDPVAFIEWLNGQFADQYFSHSYFGRDYTETDIKPFTEDLVNYRVGPARLRQLRIVSEPCLGPLGRGLTCYSKYADNKLDTVDYCLGWQHGPCDLSEKSDYFTSPAWEYKSAEEVWGFFTLATYATYGGGGYFMKLDVNRDVCLRIFDELVKFNWFDRQTRASILEFTLYNANKNLFVYSKFVAEFPEVGGVITYTDIQVFRLYLNTGEGGDIILLLEFLFAILVFVATIKMIYEIATDGFKFFKSVWNLLDLSALLMSYTTIGVYIYKLSILERTIALFHEDKNAYVGFENLAFYDYFVNTTLGILVFLLSIRVSKILGYSGKINEMAEVISSSADDLGGFFLIFAITYFAYVILGTELFRNDTEKYKDMFQTYGTLTEAIVGKNRLANILTNQPGYAEFYYFTFVIFVLLTLATMAAAILNFSISHVREEQKKLAPTNIVEILADRISWLFNMISTKILRNTGANKLKDDADNDEANAKLILEDIGNFIRTQLRFNRGAKQEKYRVPTPTAESPHGNIY